MNEVERKPGGRDVEEKNDGRGKAHQKPTPHPPPAHSVTQLQIIYLAIFAHILETGSHHVTRHHATTQVPSRPDPDSSGLERQPVH